MGNWNCFDTLGLTHQNVHVVFVNPAEKDVSHILELLFDPTVDDTDCCSFTCFFQLVRAVVQILPRSTIPVRYQRMKNPNPNLGVGELTIEEFVETMTEIAKVFDEERHYCMCTHFCTPCCCSSCGNCRTFATVLLHTFGRYQFKCPHKLTRFETPSAWACSLCKKRLEEGVIMFGCRECNHDECLECHNAESQDAQPDDELF